MADKLLSIVILNWNRLHYTRQTLECIIKKTTVPHELIFVDNGSVDGTREYLKDMENKTNAEKVTYVFNDKNLGVAGGRNSGLVHATGDYLLTIDDDVLVPDKWDIHLTAACDKIPQLGITGVNVEPIKFPVQEINGVRVRPKTIGNLGGACLCLPRRVFKRVGYYRIYGQYGLEDSDMFVRLNQLNLMSAYIESKGIHLDTDQDKVYRKVKNRAHVKKSAPLKAFARAKVEYQKTGNIFVPYISYDPDDAQWKEFERFDDTIKAKKDLREIFDSFEETKDIRLGDIPLIGGPEEVIEKIKIEFPGVRVNSNFEVAKKYAREDVKKCYIKTGNEIRGLKEDGGASTGLHSITAELELEPIINADDTTVFSDEAMTEDTSQAGHYTFDFEITTSSFATGKPFRFVVEEETTLGLVFGAGFVTATDLDTIQGLVSMVPTISDQVDKLAKAMDDLTEEVSTGGDVGGVKKAVKE